MKYSIGIINRKSMGKVNGSYASIGCAGSSNKVFDVLTKEFSEEIKIKQNQKEEIWKKNC